VKTCEEKLRFISKDSLLRYWVKVGDIGEETGWFGLDMSAKTKDVSLPEI